HWLEAWSDVRTFDGTASIVQPLIRPLYDSVSPHAILEALMGDSAADSYDVVRNYWRNRWSAEGGEANFESAWRAAVHDGVVPGTQSPEASVALAGDLATKLPPVEALSGSGSTVEVDVVFRYDPSIYDGRFANNGWLQELPRPLTKLTWDNVVHVSPRTAEQLGLKTEMVAQLEV